MLFPLKTQLNKIMPKAKFMQFAKLSTASRSELNANVERLILANILRKDTINIESGKDVKEINVFEFLLKEKSISDNLIKDIDSAIPKHILYVLKYEDEIQMVVSYKEKLTNSDKYKVLKIYRTQWQKIDMFKITIEGLNLDVVFNNFVQQIADGKVEVDENTTMSDAVQKSIDREKLNRKIEQLKNKIKRETQFNKQLELKKELKELNNKLINNE